MDGSSGISLFCFGFCCFDGFGRSSKDMIKDGCYGVDYSGCIKAA